MKNYKVPENKINISTIFLGIYFLSLPLDFMPLGSGTSILKFIVIIPIALTLLRFNNIRFKFNGMFILPILYFFNILMSSLYSTNQSDSIGRSITIFLNLILLILCTSIEYNRKEKEYLVKMLVLGGWVVVLLLIFFGNTDIMSGRLTLVINGKFQDPNYLCGYMLFTIIYYLDEFKKSKNLANLIKVLIFITVVFFTGSRGGLIAVSGSIIIYFLINSKQKIKNICLLIMILSILPISLNFMPEDVQDRYSLEFTAKDGGANRFEMWRDIIENYQDFDIYNKVLGVGAATIRDYNSYNNVAHNVWIETLCENGIVGLIILMLFYFNYIKYALKLDSKIYVSVFLGYIIMTMSLSLYAYKPIWALLLLIKIQSENITKSN